jgi:AcrR family transcriptional regulator
MDKPKPDRRIRKTKMQIRQALLHLLAKKDLMDISVSELAVQADINRGTFYLHYDNIFHLFREIEQQIYQEFSCFVSQYKTNINSSILCNLFQYVKDNSQTFSVLTQVRESTIIKRIIYENRPKNARELNRMYPRIKINKEQYTYCYEFVSYGATAMIRLWLERGMREPPEQIAELTQRLTIRCIEK